MNSLALKYFFFNSAARKLVTMSPELVNAPKEDGFTSLHLSAVNDHCEIAEIILAQVSPSRSLFSDLSLSIYQSSRQTQQS